MKRQKKAGKCKGRCQESVQLIFIRGWRGNEGGGGDGESDRGGGWVARSEGCGKDTEWE